MSESCPLRGGRQAVHGIPEFCNQNCRELWGKAVSDQAYYGGYDHYGDDPSGCEAEVEYSHDGLQPLDDSSLRLYSIVDYCVQHEVELGEQTYRFDCRKNN